MNNPGYFIDSIASQPLYRCLKCRYDTFALDSARYHVRSQCPPAVLPEDDLSTSDWLILRRGELHGIRIGISLLTWNTCEASIPAAEAMINEAIRLEHLGIHARLFWADNGSTDGTVPALESIFGESLAAKFLLSVNLGQSVARNLMCQAFLKTNCDFLLMIDGDVEIIPYSTFAFARYLDSVDSFTGCIGMSSRNCTHKTEPEVALYCRKVDPWMVSQDPAIAWTQYGLFRRYVIQRCQFDESGPFSGPGWGFEDDDYYLQMLTHGYRAVNTKYFRYLHRRRHSSVKLLGKDFATQNHRDRQQYLVAKWASVPEVAERIRNISHQTMPVLEY